MAEIDINSDYITNKYREFNTATADAIAQYIKEAETTIFEMLKDTYDITSAAFLQSPTIKYIASELIIGRYHIDAVNDADKVEWGQTKINNAMMMLRKILTGEISIMNTDNKTVLDRLEDAIVSPVLSEKNDGIDPDSEFYNLYAELENDCVY